MPEVFIFQNNQPIKLGEVKSFNFERTVSDEEKEWILALAETLAERDFLEQKSASLSFTVDEILESENIE